jgi:hypothetical protein
VKQLNDVLATLDFESSEVTNMAIFQSQDNEKKFVTSAVSFLDALAELLKAVAKLAMNEAAKRQK